MTWPWRTPNHILFIFVSRLQYALNQQDWVTKSRWAHPLWQAAIINMVPKVREENHRGWVQNLFQRPSKSQFLPSLPLSIPCCHHFILPLPAPFWGEVGERGWIVYLTLICSVVSFGEMTCNLGGKGHLFLFPSSESQFTAPGDVFPKLQTISHLPHCFGFTQLEGAKEEAPLLSSFSDFIQLNKIHSYLFKHLHFIHYCICKPHTYIRSAVTVI